VDVACTFDYDQFIGEFVDKENVSGCGSVKRLVTEPGEGRPVRQDVWSTEVSHLQLCMPEGGELAKMRYKTFSQSTVWFPIGANGRTDIGMNIFKEGAVLPGLHEKPPLAEYTMPWKTQEEVTDTFTTMHETRSLYQTLR
jgi:hypothetical protein